MKKKLNRANNCYPNDYQCTSHTKEKQKKTLLPHQNCITLLENKK